VEKKTGKYVTDELVPGPSGSKTIIERKGDEVTIVSEYNMSFGSDTYYKIGPNFQFGDMVSVWVDPPSAATYHLYDENDNLILSFSGGAHFMRFNSGWYRVL
jgi:hypothetical protein